MKTMNYRRMLSTLAVAAVLSMTMTACSGKGSSDTEKETSAAEGTGEENVNPAEDSSGVKSTLPVDASMTEIAYQETDPEYEKAEVSATIPVTEAVTEASSEPSGDSGGNSGGGSGGGSWEKDIDPAVRNAYADLSRFYVYKGSEKGAYSLRVTNDFDEFTGENQLNEFGDFIKIGDEKYSGYLTEAFGFEGEAYWLRGEGSQKCYIETNGNGEIMAIAFTNVSQDFAMEFDCKCPYTDSETMDNVGKFEMALKDGENEKPYFYTSGDGNCEIMTFNDGAYSLSLEMVYNAGKDNLGALKTIIITDNKRNK